MEKMGYGSGVHKLYRRLHSIFGERDHPAINSQGNVVYTKDGDVWEELNTPKNIKDHSYVHDGAKYTYETREVVRKGKKSIQRRKFLPTRLAIQDFLSMQNLIFERIDDVSQKSCYRIKKKGKYRVFTPEIDTWDGNPKPIIDIGRQNRVRAGPPGFRFRILFPTLTDSEAGLS